MIRPLDYWIVGIYLFGAVALGIACRGRQKNIDDYFTASGRLDGRIGTILVGLSIAPISGLSLLAIPAVSYEHGFKLALIVVCLPILWIILHFFFLPRFLKGGVRNAYDVIEQHFGSSVRTTAALIFVALRIGWLAALVYAPALMVLTILGLDREWFWPVNLAIGICCTLYTMLGGVRGVIITDAVQTTMMMVGMGFVVGFVLLKLPVSLPAALAELRSAGHLPIADFSLSFTERFTVWSIVLGWTAGNLSSYMADQMQLQRFLATGSAKAASRSFGINVAGSVFTVLLLIGIGIMLRVWYAHEADPNLPGAADKILPYFVAHRLPSGISGLLIASILATTMSAMTSGINSVSGSLTNDFFVRFGRLRGEAELLRFARLTSLIIGLVATVLAGSVEQLGSIFDIQIKIMGCFNGPLLACMILVVLRVRIRPWGMIAGMLAGGVIGWLITNSAADSMWVPPGSFLATIVIATIAGKLFWAPEAPVAAIPRQCIPK